MRRISPLKLEIIKRGLVQADVAAAAQISESRLSRFLNGRVTIQPEERRRLELVLGESAETPRLA